MGRANEGPHKTRAARIHVGKAKREKFYNPELAPLISEIRPNNPEADDLEASKPPNSLAHQFNAISPFLVPKTWKLRFFAFFSFVLTLLSKIFTLLIPISLKHAVDGLAYSQSSYSSVIFYASSFGLLRFLSGALTEFRTIIWQRVSLDTTRAFSVNTFQHLHSLSISFHLKSKTEAILRVMDRGVSSLSTLIQLLVFTLFPTVFELIAVAWIFTQFNLPLAAVITLVAVLIFALYTLKFTQARNVARKSFTEKDNAVTEVAVDSLMNFEAVKTFGAESFEVNRYSKYLEEYQEASLATALTMSALNTGQKLIVNACITIVLCIAADQGLKGEISIGEFVMVNTYIIQLFQPLTWLGQAYKTIQEAFQDTERMMDLTGLIPEIQDFPGADKVHIDKGKVEFKAVDFEYEPDRPILRKISFLVEPGKTLGIVGRTGSGKSSLVKLLLRLYDVTGGSILIDDQNIAFVQKESLKHALGVVSQDTVVFHDTIRYNIEYARPGDEVSLQETKQAATAAQLSDFIDGLKDGYETYVGERELRLSDCEKQRIAIARMFIKDPKIVIVDEATSSLDGQTERAFQTALRDLCAGRTCIITAHRLSTIIDADEIIVLKDGEIVEKGSHKQLLNLGGEYTRMWNAQLESENATVELSRASSRVDTNQNHDS